MRFTFSIILEFNIWHFTLQSSRPVTKFTEDFDFIAMNEKFNKDEVWGNLGKGNKSHHKDKDVDGNVSDEEDEEEEDEGEVSQSGVKVRTSLSLTSYEILGLFKRWIQFFSNHDILNVSFICSPCTTRMTSLIHSLIMLLIMILKMGGLDIRSK